MSNFSEQLGEMTKLGGWWDYVDMGLNGLGFIPGIGTIANGISAAGNALQGNWGQAGLAAAGMIPGVGVMSGAARGAGLMGKVMRGANAVGSAVHAMPGVASAVRTINPAFRAAQAYSKPMTAISNYGGLAAGYLGNNSQHNPQQTMQSWHNMPMATAAQSPQFHMPNLSMFTNFFNQGQGQGQQQMPQQQMANNFRPHSIYGNT